MGKLTVVAIGGNALLDPTLPPTIENQFAVTAKAMRHVADFVQAGEEDDRVVLTHGNGPQVGFKALRSQISRDQVHEVPLDSLVAETQGSMGYMIQRALRGEIKSRGLPFEVSSIVTEVEVDPDDQAFKEPTKPIGGFYPEALVEKLSRERGWQMVEDSHRGWRRVVPSPAPVRILQLDQIVQLTKWGSIVIACGGGGIPLVVNHDGKLIGVEGVIDKDRSSSLLGARMGAERLVITTAVYGVYKDFLTEHRTLLREVTISELNALEAEGQFPPGSMGPKIKAADRFLAHGGKEVVICLPEHLVAATKGEAGTRIFPG